MSIPVHLRGLRAVAMVARLGGVAAAAQALHQSPAAISRAVQAVERSLGIDLFDRGPRGMSATIPCQSLALRVDRAFDMLDSAAVGLKARGKAATLPSLARVSETWLQAIVARGQHPTQSLAAQSLGLSQSALHQALTSLENAARVPLFERTRAGTRLNSAGEWMLQHAKLALAEVRIGLDELAAWRGESDGRVSIGALPMATDVLVPQACAEVMSAHPRLSLMVKDGTYESLTRLLRHADIDFMVGPLRAVALADDLEEETLFIDRFVAVVRRGHPALRNGPVATLKRLAAFPWIGPLPGTPALAVFDRLLERAGKIRPAVTMQAHSSAVVRSMLLATDHVALASPHQVSADVEAGLLVHASKPLADTERAIGITQRRGALASASCALLLEALRTVAERRQAATPA